MKADLFAGISGVMLSIVVWLVSASFPSFAVSKAGPAYYPRMVALVFGFTCIALIYQALKEKATCEKLSGGELKRLGVIILIFIGYYLCMNWLGYFTSTFIAGFILAMYVFGSISKKEIILSLVNATVICIGIYVIFQILLKAPLPRGILF